MSGPQTWPSLPETALQGSERSRYSADDPSEQGAVLMDENLRESNLSAPILIDPVAYARCEAPRRQAADSPFLHLVAGGVPRRACATHAGLEAPHQRNTLKTGSH